MPRVSEGFTEPAGISSAPILLFEGEWGTSPPGSRVPPIQVERSPEEIETALAIRVQPIDLEDLLPASIPRSPADGFAILAPMYREPCPLLVLSEGEDCTRDPRSAVLQVVSELAELIPAVLCSFVSTAYVLRAEQAGPLDSDDTIFPPLTPWDRFFAGALPRLDFLTRPSGGLMLGSCLVLGCCLSSYTHRRRSRDPYQPLVFMAWAAWAACIGLGFGCNADMVMLGLLPWALCAAVLSSYLGHAAAARWLAARRRKCETDAVLLRLGAGIITATAGRRRSGAGLVG
ncbi:hypothetical protein DL764_005078 [Monosporascus ibericus]|uniref:Uncharacterized protein n=1 Tax=Monosporascus ibericus TaxID=155417 RepID=A0A4Q4TE50_9PEZI|nr:hypothetical protein DL764_005078 [Monosporascus ibericus]